MATSLIYHPNSQEEFDKIVAETPYTALVDFYADWCGPCQSLAPILSDLIAEQKPVQFILIKVNVDELSDLADSLGVQGIPALKIIQNKKFLEIPSLVGNKGKDAVKKYLGDVGVVFPVAEESKP